MWNIPNISGKLEPIRIRIGSFKITFGERWLRNRLIDALNAIEWTELTERVERLGFSEHDAAKLTALLREYITTLIPK